MFISATFTGGSNFQRFALIGVLALVNISIGAGLLYGATRIVRFGWLG